MLSNCLIDLIRTTMMPLFSFGRLMCSLSLAVSCERMLAGWSKTRGADVLATLTNVSYVARAF